MRLDDFIIPCFCLLDGMAPSVTKGKRLRERGPQPKLADSEVITIELVGTSLGLVQDQKVFDYFRRHSAHFFPTLTHIVRTTFVRQAANLWAVKERLWCLLRDPLVSIIESMSVPVCRFARAPWCSRFRDIASYGKDHTERQTFYGFLLHLRLGWPEVITHLFLAPTNEQDSEIAPVLTEGIRGLVLGDRNYWVPRLQEEMRVQGISLQAPFCLASSPKADAYHSSIFDRVRYLVDTVFGQLTDRFGIKLV